MSNNKKKSRYIPKNKQNGLSKGAHRVWIENVKYLTPEEYNSLIKAMKKHSKPNLVKRNILLVTIALNNGLRASDVVTLRVGDVLNKTRTKIVEQKTGKLKQVYWHNCLAEIIEYMNELDYSDENDFLFPGGQNGHFSVHGFYQMLIRIARKADNPTLASKIGTHSFRKTFGRELYSKGTDIEIISQLFNHSSQRVTRRYLGIEQEDLDRVVENFNFNN
ncbi:tyrosine-type recombinase/integrase [Ligilactobacillus faecis]|uniref:Tyrosine-type recombinase/integrase n=1 Tax=Ligilactobacillus faecis TaxID=762833 RepID=A0ABV4DM80_9LACO